MPWVGRARRPRDHEGRRGWRPNARRRVGDDTGRDGRRRAGSDRDGWCCHGPAACRQHPRDDRALDRRVAVDFQPSVGYRRTASTVVRSPARHRPRSLVTRRSDRPRCMPARTTGLRVHRAWLAVPTRCAIAAAHDLAHRRVDRGTSRRCRDLFDRDRAPAGVERACGTGKSFVGDSQRTSRHFARAPAPGRRRFAAWHRHGRPVRAPKRQDELVEAMATLTNLAWTLTLVGDGPGRDRCEDRASRLLGERVRFLGERDDVEALLAASDIAVLWSDYEGLPISMLEAMRAGVACVGSDLPGIRELFGDPPVGVIASTKRDLADRISELVADRSGRRSLGELARRRFEQSYSASAMAASTHRVYTAVLERRAACADGARVRGWRR